MKKILSSLLLSLALLVPSLAIAQAPPQSPPVAVLAGQSSISATSTSSRVALPASNTTFYGVTVYNNGTKDAYFALGSVTVTATTSSTFIGAGTHITVWAGQNTYVAGITAGSDTTTLKIYQANGGLEFGALPGASNGANAITALTGDVTATGPGSAAATVLGVGHVNTGILGNTYGGTGASLAATGGASQVLMQTSVGGVVTVARLACADLSNAGSGCSGSATTPGGSTTQLQYNNAGAFGGISGATTNGTAVTLTGAILNGTLGATTPAAATVTTLTANTSVTIGAGSAITSSGPGGALGSNAFTSTAYLPLTAGTGSPLTGIVVHNLNSTTAPAAITGTGILVSPADSVVGRVQANSYGAIAAFTTARYDGTLASPTAVQANDQIGGFNAYAYDGSTLDGPIASFRCYATDLITAAHWGSKCAIATAATNTTTLTDKFTVDQAGLATYTTLAGGAQQISGAVTFSATNTYDIGTSATVLAPRTVYAGTSMVAPTFAGNSSPLNAAIGSGYGLSAVTVAGAVDPMALVSIGTSSNQRPTLEFYRTRSTVDSTPVLVTNNDGIGGFTWNGARNGAAYAAAAAMYVYIDGVTSSTSMPGKFEFWTTPLNSLNPVLHLALDNTGAITQSGAISGAATTTTGSRFIQAAANVTDTSSSGTVATNYVNRWGVPTLLASSATVYTNNYANWFEPATCSTNVTCTNNWAAGFNGQIAVIGPASNTSALTIPDNTVITNASKAGALRLLNNDIWLYSNFNSGSIDMVIKPLALVTLPSVGSYGFTSSSTSANAAADSGINRQGVSTVGVFASGATTGTGGTLISLNAVHGGTTTASALITSSPIAINANVTSLTGTSSPFIGASDASANTPMGLVAYGNNTFGAQIAGFKTRAATTAASTIVSNGDIINRISGWAADGGAYINMAKIDFVIDGTPGSSDMPGAIKFYTTPDGSATPGLALTIDNTKLATFAGNISMGANAETFTSGNGTLTINGTSITSTGTNTDVTFQAGTGHDVVLVPNGGGTGTIKIHQAIMYPSSGSTSLGNTLFGWQGIYLVSSGVVTNPISLTTSASGLTISTDGGTTNAPIIASNATFSGQVVVTAMTQTSAAQSGTVCYNSGTGAITYDATLGCLASLEETKDIRASISPTEALDIESKLNPFWFSYKPGAASTDLHEHAGLGAHAVEAVDNRLVGYDKDGNLRGVRYADSITSLNVAAIQGLRAENADLRAQIAELRRDMQHAGIQTAANDNWSTWLTHAIGL